jgi:hypothetical protein
MAPIIMVLGGGTGTSYHICKTIKKYFGFVHLIVCDINPKHLVHASVFADEFITVPPIKDINYEKSMYDLFENRNVNVLIPIIDLDLRIFCCDNEWLIKHNILSTGPKRQTFDTLSNKKVMNKYLTEIGITTPHLYSSNEVYPEKDYYIKDIIGFGSLGVYKAKGSMLKNIDETKVIQELLFRPEITVDVFTQSKKVWTLCRERIEIKSGVSTKIRAFSDENIQKTIEQIASSIELPTVSCIQFMTNEKGQWSLTDFNLRPGAGTAMSDAVGFQSLRAALTVWLNMGIKNLLQPPNEDKYVVRAYEEFVADANNSI